MAVQPTRRQQRWWRLGLVLIASFLGHDLVMAAAQVVLPDDQGAHNVAEVTAAPHHDASPGHPADCGVARSAAPRAIDQPDVSADPAPLFPLTAGILALPISPSPIWELTTWSSSLRRVLLQVFRL